MTKIREVLGVGTPILDHLISVDPSFLKTIQGKPYGMELVSYDEMISIIESSGSIPLQIAGGSCCNTIKGLASLGHACALTGKIGLDLTGEKVINELKKSRVEPLVCYNGSPTAHVACLITPDGKRTCRSFMGAGGEMTPEDLDPKYFQGVKLVHIEGYSLLVPGLTKQAMKYAKEAGALISFDMGSFEIVKEFQSSLYELLSEYVSILFSNEEETRSFTGKDPKEGCKVLSSLCQTAAVMVGKNGCWIGSGEELFHSSAFPTVPLDTTGAGDLFASGFLHGMLKGLPLKECARYGAITGAAVVQLIGAEIPSSSWPEIVERMTSS